MPLATPQTRIAPRREGRAGGLWWFVLFSIALHLWLFWAWQRHPQEISATPSPATPIGIRLVTASTQPVRQVQGDKARQNPVPTAPRAEPATPSSADEGASAQRATAPAGSQLPAAAATRSSVAPDPGEGKAETAPVTPAQAQPVQEAATPGSNSVGTQTGTDAARQQAQARERASSHIRLELARHFSYPLLARRRGWQGEVLLAFQLAADGRIHDARIARSSGHGVLDRAALKALERVAPLKHNSPAGITLKIPVIYRLEG